MKKTLAIILVLTVIFGMTVVFAAGTEADPLVTKSFVEGEFRASFRDTIREIGTQVAAEPMIGIRINAVNEKTGYAFTGSFIRKDLSYLSSITLLPGSSFILASGAATVVYPGGTVINVSDAVPVNSGTALAKDKRYFCSEDTAATIISMGISSGYVDGYYKTEVFQTTSFIERLYREVLERTYDAFGLMTWVDRIVSGQTTVAQVAHGFIFSAELTARNLSDDAFVEMLYRTMMGRASDPDGKAAWISRLGSGMTRQAVFDGFIVSVEWNRICTEYGLVPSAQSPIPAGVRVFVDRLYSEITGRQGDLSGRDYWMREIQSGKISGSQAAREFVFSAEVANRNLSNADFIEMLYRAMIGRPSDPAGKAYWVNILETGSTRQKVFDGFVESAEFSELCRTLAVRK